MSITPRWPAPASRGQAKACTANEGSSRRRGTLAFLGSLTLLLTVAAPARPAVPVISAPASCMIDQCRSTVTYTVGPEESARVEIDWDHQGPAEQNFSANKTLACDVAGSPDAIAPGASAACAATSPLYRSAGATQVAVRVSPTGSAPVYFTRAITVIGRTRTPRSPGAEDALCAPRRAGVNCGPGNGRRAPGGGEKVSHKGWPSITGILWQVVMFGGNHQKTGGPENDELLGHHGDEVLRGRGGKDVIWGDWDPKNNGTRQIDRLYGDAGDDWIYSSHGRNTISGGTGKDYIWAYYGRGTIDCGPGFDTLRIRIGAPYSYRNCERIKNFCSFGSKPGNKGGCYKPGERPASKRSTR